MGRSLWQASRECYLNMLLLYAARQPYGKAESGSRSFRSPRVDFFYWVGGITPHHDIFNAQNKFCINLPLHAASILGLTKSSKLWIPVSIQTLTTTQRISLQLLARFYCSKVRNCFCPKMSLALLVYQSDFCHNQ